jgi:hypothetical protein
MSGWEGRHRRRVRLLLDHDLGTAWRHLVTLSGNRLFRNPFRDGPPQSFQKKKSQGYQDNDQDQDENRPFSRRLFSPVCGIVSLSCQSSVSFWASVQQFITQFTGNKQGLPMDIRQASYLFVSILNKSETSSFSSGVSGWKLTHVISSLFPFP